MKNILKYIFSALIAISTCVIITACSDDEDAKFKGGSIVISEAILAIAAKSTSMRQKLPTLLATPMIKSLSRYPRMLHPDVSELFQVLNMAFLRMNLRLSRAL
jgi:hypothetical protein